MKSFRSLATMLAAAFVAAAVLPQSALAQGCQFDAQRSPANGVPQELWGDLKPVDEGVLPSFRDNTDWNRGGIGQVGSSSNPRWVDLDIAGGWIFTGIHYGFQVWDARNTPEAPVRQSVVAHYEFPSWPSDPHEGLPVRSISAGPNGNHRVVAVGVAGDGGLNVFDTTSKSDPSPLYTDRDKAVNETYTAAIDGREYLFAGTNTTGLTYYDLTDIQDINGACSEETPGQSYCGVYRGRLGIRSSISYLGGVGSEDGTEHWMAVSSGTSAFGFELWDLSNPSSPSMVLSAFNTGSISSWRFVYGVAMWRDGSSYYLALRRTTSSNNAYAMEIYDMSCLAGSGCSSLGTPIWSTTHPGQPANNTLTFSRADSRPFLHVGNFNRCVASDQNEWLYDVSVPQNPRDVTPPTRTVGGEEIGYWGWYYPANSTGFNEVAALTGLFNGPYFYRAAFSIFDIHELTTAGPPEADFDHSPAEVYVGEDIDFLDRSTGGPTGWSWSFASANPSSSAAQNPAAVNFTEVGSHDVTLTVESALGSDSITRTIEVYDPAAAVAGVSTDLNPALVCQQVSFTAGGVTGLAPLTLAWQVHDKDDAVVASGGDVNPFVWDTSLADPAGSPFTATVTVSNAGGSTTAASGPVTLQALPPLAFTSPGNAPETLNGPPFDSGRVDFRIASQGATEWRWFFGDGAATSWSSDPAMSAVSHNYAGAGTYDATVRIRNCQEGPLTSEVTQVVIENTSPLIADFNAVNIFCGGLGCFADAGQSISFIDLSSGDPDFYDYDWNGDGLFEDEGNTLPVAAHTYDSPGIFAPRLRVRRGGASDTFTHDTIQVGDGIAPAPEITVTGPSSGLLGVLVRFDTAATDCSPYPSSWNWSVGDGGLIFGDDSGSSILVLYSTLGAKLVSAEAASGGCNGTSGSAGITIGDDAAHVFSGGFETGTTELWSVVSP